MRESPGRGNASSWRQAAPVRAARALATALAVSRSALLRLLEGLLERAPSLGLDALYVGVLLVGSYFLFLRNWPLWDDLGIYHYMAWGVRHGLVLYRDVINMNWPGTVFVHVLAQWMTGMDPAGIRIMECLFLGVLGLTTCALLRDYGVPTAVRLASFTVFLIAYFLGGFEATAQRETWMTPCLVVGLYPLLTADAAGARRGRLRWILGGALAASAIVVKPTAAPVLAAGVLIALVSERPPWRRLADYVLAGFAVLATAVTLLAIYGDLAGFWRWGVEFALGPYAKLRYQDGFLRESIVSELHDHSFKPLFLLCAAGLCVFAAVNLFFVVAVPISGRRIWDECRATAKRVLCHVLIASVALATIYLQGKSHCIYHFIPLEWSLAVLGATFFAAPFPRLVAAWLPLRETTRRALANVAFVAAVGLWAAYVREPARATPPDEVKEEWRKVLARSLGPNETVVVFGFVGPTLMCELERPSPLPFVDSWIIYSATPAGSTFRSEYVEKWERAMASPNVRYFIVQTPITLKPGLRFEGGDDDASSEAAMARYFPEPKLKALGFERTPALGVPGLDVYERATTPKEAH